MALFLAGLREKQITREGPALANLSRYHFSPAIFEHIDRLEPDPVTGELMITTAIENLARTGEVAVCVAGGSYFDCGSADGWLSANNAVAQLGFPWQSGHEDRTDSSPVDKSVPEGG